MSAYLCGAEDFAKVAAYAAGHKWGFHAYNGFNKEAIGDGDLDAVAIALKLATANIASVAYRYPNHGKFGGFLDSDEELVEFLGDCAVEARKAEKAPRINAADAYALLAEIEYQSDQRPDWIEQDAYWLLDRIKNNAAREMMNLLAEQKEAA
jgi:hypothetical protein|tara:strand:- start:572 stop:1027 length:456 start_codon:yes stop_codon:yes gene_type:complete